MAPDVVAIMVTRRCTMACAHCSVESSPKLRGQPGELELVQRVQEAADAGARALQITGGEPMMRAEVCLDLVKRARAAGMYVIMTSNGFWGKQAREAERLLRALLDAGLDRLTLSYDRYHREFQGPEPLANIVRAAALLGFGVDIVVTRNRDDQDMAALLEPFQGFTNVQFRFYDVQSVGAAKGLPQEELRGEVEGFCSACNFPAITDDGRLTACNGPAYFSGAHSPLRVGRLDEKPLAELFETHAQDVILETIRSQGPAQLRRHLESLPGFEDFPFKPAYTGACELCLQITSDARAVEALREHLEDPDLRAERAAIAMVARGARHSGVLNRELVNTSLLMRQLLELLEGGAAADKLLGRADIDWASLLRRIAGAGLAGAVQRREGLFSRWAPSFFLEDVARQALLDSQRESDQREALAPLEEGLEVIGQAALRLGRRSLGVWLQKPEALSRYLRTVGWREAEPGVLTRGQVRVELRSRLLPRSWGFPENEMWERSRPECGRLLGLAPEARLLLATAECSRQLFAPGLETAWEVRELLRGSLDLALVQRWLAQSGSPRAVTVCLQAMCSELQMPPLPFEVRDRRQALLLKGARYQLFARRSHPFTADPWLRLGVWVLLHERVSGQVACLLSNLASLRGSSPLPLLRRVPRMLRSR